MTSHCLLILKSSDHGAPTIDLVQHKEKPSVAYYLAAACGHSFLEIMAEKLQEKVIGPYSMEVNSEYGDDHGKDVSHLVLKVEIPQMEESVFTNFVKEARNECVASQVLKVECKILFTFNAPN